MIVTVSTREFLRELELLSNVVMQKPTLPVLSNFLIQADGNGLRLAATDLEIGLITFCPATVSQAGATTLPAKHMLEIVRLLGEQDITLALDGNTVKLSAGRYNARVQTYPSADFVILPSMNGTPTLTLPRQLQAMLNRVRFAVSDKDKRFFMDGALLTKSSLAATDGHRLAYTTCEDFGLETPVIIPSKTIDKLAEMLAGETTIAVGERHLFFVVDGRLLFSRMVAGQFPNYERIIPRDTIYSMVIPAGEFTEALKRITLTSNEVVLKITPGCLYLSGRSAQLGDAVEQIGVSYDGQEQTVTLQGAYLLDFFSLVSGTVSVQWKDQQPMLFSSGNDYAYVQMPLRNV